MESNATTASCQLGHRIFNFPTGFISKSMIVDMMEGIPRNIMKLITNKLCELPGTEGVFHCHCSSETSLECLASRALLEHLCNSIDHIPFKSVPFTYCCSLFKAFKTSSRLFIVCNTKSLDKILLFLIFECALKCHVFNVVHCGLSVIEIFVEAFKMDALVTMLNQRINLDCKERYGYHLGEYIGWKHYDTRLYGGQWCSIRFVDISGLYQERAIKNYPVSNEVSNDYVFPPPTKSGEFWICYYAFMQCNCLCKCKCVDKFDTVKLNFECIQKYVSGELRKPRSLRNYILYYLTHFEK